MTMQRHPTLSNEEILAVEEAAGLASPGAASGGERVLQEEQHRAKEALEAAERNLEALTAEEIAGIERIFGFDPRLNPLNILMLHAKKNLECHGFYGLPAGQRLPASEPSEVAIVPPPTAPAPEQPVTAEAREAQHLIDNKLRLDRLRGETQERNAAQGLRDAVASRSRF